MNKEIKKYGENILREKAVEVKNIDGKISRIVKGMKDVMLKFNGVGLASLQIGIKEKIFVAHDTEKEKIVTAINPKIIEINGKEIDMEGCLSFPEIYFSIERPTSVIVKAYNLEGKEIFLEGENLMARCFLHEMDHLDGKLIIDYATTEEKKFWKEKIKELETNQKSKRYKGNG
jgi:peptide deformylase